MPIVGLLIVFVIRQAEVGIQLSTLIFMHISICADIVSDPVQSGGFGGGPYILIVTKYQMQLIK